MTVHRLHAGDGYSYLTRQVATADHERSAGEKLTDYYTADGTPPGQWHGRGARALGVSGDVSEAQMKALFGEGLHPDADHMVTERISEGVSPDEAVRSARLGSPFYKITAPDSPVDAELARQMVAFRAEHGRPVTAVERVGLRHNAAASVVTARTGQPATQAQVVAALATDKRGDRHPVAGFDLVFTPQKSVSLLWGLGDDEVRRTVARVHAQAVTDTLEWLQTEAGKTRRGRNGVRQIDTEGLVVARFDHFDNRTGDPNLHTHAVVSNKVRGVDGAWSSLDARVLYATGVAASARYNALVTDGVRRELGVSFEERVKGANKAPVLEVIGVSDEMVAAFSRRADVMARTDELVAQYRDTHAHEPSRVALLRITQQAVLDTRQTKGAPRSLAAMREQWATQGRTHTEGIEPAQWLNALIATHRDQAVGVDGRGAFSAATEARRVVVRVSRARATWTEANLRSAAEDAVAVYSFPTPEQARRAVEDVVREARDGASLRLSVDPDGPAPAGLARADGASVYSVHGAARFTSDAVLDAEHDLLTAAHTPVASGFVTGAAADTAMATVAAQTGRELNDGQAVIARHLLCSGQLLAVAVGPAGAGKTTAMKAVVTAWTGDGRQVLALAPSAAAARVLGADVGAPAQTIAKLLTTEHHRNQEGQASQILPGAMLLVDEAGMTATADLAALVELAREQGAVLRLVGDPYQLAAVESGGALRLLARDTGAPELTDIVRFTDPGEAAAGLAIRGGEAEAAWAFYADHDRVHTGTATELREQVLAAHTTDTTAGRTSLMLAATTADVTALNTAAQGQRVLTGEVDPTSTGVRLRDGLGAHAGDTVVTRRNNTALRVQGGDRGGCPVANGDLWRVRQVHDDGSLTLSGITHRGTLVVPAEYTTAHVELGYAATVHRAQGMTTDTAHLLTDDTLTRAGVYVGLTRGREANHLYLATDDDPTTAPSTGHDSGLEAHHHLGRLSQDTPAVDPREVFTRIVSRTDDNLAATDVLATELDHADDTTRLRGIHHDATTTLATTHAAYLLDRALPAVTTTEIAASEHYRDLLATLAAAGAHGLDTTALVTAITDPRTPDPDQVVDPLTGVRDAAAVLRHRADEWVAAHHPDQDAVTAGRGKAGGFRTLRDLPERTQLDPSPVRHPGMDTDLADYTSRLGDRIHRLEAAATTAGAGGVDREVIAEQLRAHPIRVLPAAAVDRALVTVRGQLAAARAGTHDTPTTQRLRAVIEAGEAERARRGALTPEQAATEADVRRELGTTTVTATPQPAPTRDRTVSVGEDYQAHLTAQYEHTPDQDLGRDV
jgi:conjugative relaxase-like TrwC/TraI family protein